MKRVKVYAFILASFKHAIDCIRIEIPLKDNIPEVNTTGNIPFAEDSVFAPRVTSKMPYKSTSKTFVFMPIFESIGLKSFESELKSLMLSRIQ